MALNGKISTEVEINIPAQELFNLFAKKLHDLQHITDRIHEGKVHHGDDWHSGDSVKHWSYTIDDKVITSKEKIEFIDEEKKSITFDLFEGDVSQYYKILKINLQVIDKDDGGAIAKWTVEYEKVDENVEPPNGYLEFLTKITKDSNHHLLNA
ncbi:hypothetical protein TanjilG_14012 [Lupinus angustifolius]|uniref:Bet v I/Major latex protein domain-containing protein n=1 Tax=Lupinus angustifolius TaxID=3871 RepID=A0A1J7HJQ9_LUPAN|nr:PREDICTED: MLP-like protein 43 [Lupinus angustifolius]OIW01981.1 hypothetical protein TanjilG_14012 [Lupinus angustifolius]